MNNTNEQKIMFSCNHHGVILEIFLDTADIFKDIQLPTGIHTIVSKSSISMLGDFWLAVKENSIEENFFVNLTNQGENIKFNFSGYLLGDQVLFCGKTEMNATQKAMVDIMLINNEQANKIRLTEKKADTIQRKRKANKKEMNELFLNDFTSLNNELINNKRELSRKNQKIELLNQELNAVNENLKMLSYSLSHDLKEPLRMVTSFLNLLQKKSIENLDTKGQRYLKFASDGAEKLSKMLNGLLEYHRADNISINEKVDLNKVLLDVKQLLQVTIKETNTELIIEKLPIVKGSHIGFQQVFLNLISNSIKFVPENRSPKIAISVTEKDKVVTLAIKDNGTGIPENKHKEVFTMFKRFHSSEEYKGTGMGLTMVKKTVERMNGKIWFTSEKDKGSTFFINCNKL